ncbi:50S ribosomal protein L11 methyltransferase [Rhizorhabdus phycosphaerae]|uniref:50S ribosomal protein L11 methyltransferase n=1 Tax=Rhizorhabdus phycosphaerae TaxID=2711156 RepID=UPI0013ECE96B|nr:50S ribosomal protein L11 methyltransferase [Rhizorhabdus phycosphaerae]
MGDGKTVWTRWPMLQGRGPDDWAMFAQVLLDKGKTDDALDLALAVLDHTDCSGRARVMASRVLHKDVPNWHWGLVRDSKRNQAYEAALRRVVGPDSLVLDIGAGTGLLSLLALRAGAGRVVACEMNPAVARMAMAIARANGVEDRLTIVPKNSAELILGEDVERPVDVIVSEIVDNMLLGEHTLAVHRDVVPRLLRPGGSVIPAEGRILAALGHDPTLESRRMSSHEGFDLSAFNRIAAPSHRIKVGDPGVRLVSDVACLFDFRFDEPDSWGGKAAEQSVTAEAGEANTIIQWMRIDLDRSGAADAVYEVRPRPGASSCWAAVSWPLVWPIRLQAGERHAIAAARTDSTLTVWLAG